MAQVVWSEPALTDLDAIADYIALDKPSAAKELVRKVFAHVAQLADFPRSGPKLREVRGYREIVEPPCRIIYRVEEETVFIVHVMRSQRRVQAAKLRR